MSSHPQLSGLSALPPRSGTPSSLSHSISMQTLNNSPYEVTRAEHTTTLSHKLISMFNSQPHSIFHANVVLHELANVPQLGGQFAVDWKFRGHKPKLKDYGGASLFLSRDPTRAMTPCADIEMQLGRVEGLATNPPYPICSSSPLSNLPLHLHPCQYRPHRLPTRLNCLDLHKLHACLLSIANSYRGRINPCPYLQIPWRADHPAVHGPKLQKRTNEWKRNRPTRLH